MHQDNKFIVLVGFALSFASFFELVVREHVDGYFVLQCDNNQIVYLNPAIEKAFHCVASDVLQQGWTFERLMVRPKRWKLILKEIESASSRGEFYVFTEELKTDKEQSTNCNFRMRKFLFEGKAYLFGEIGFSKSCNDQGVADRANTLMLRNTNLMRDVSFNKYVYDLIFKIQKSENINDIIALVCERLTEREKSEFSVEIIQLHLLKSDHVQVEYSATIPDAKIEEFALLSRVKSFLKTASNGDVLRDGSGGIAIAINLYELEHLDAVLVIKTHSEELLIKEIAELKVIVNSMARQINTLYLTNRLKRESIEDPLTGIFNRRFFDKSIREEVNRAGRHKRDLSLIFIDIDYFKKVNDVYGHVQGDLCLKEVARIVNTTGRGSDRMFRYGGEEFVVLLPETNFSNAMIRAEKIRELIQGAIFENLNDKDKPLKITISLGVCEYQTEHTIETFIDCADNALYRAKSSGRNKVVGANSV